jgi:hypothetical protein
MAHAHARTHSVNLHCVKLSRNKNACSWLPNADKKLVLAMFKPFTLTSQLYEFSFEKVSNKREGNAVSIPSNTLFTFARSLTRLTLLLLWSLKQCFSLKNILFIITVITHMQKGIQVKEINTKRIISQLVESIEST